MVESNQGQGVSLNPGDRFIRLAAIEGVAQGSLTALSRAGVSLDRPQDIAEGHVVDPFHAVIGDFQG